jgi:hypothetical protein
MVLIGSNLYNGAGNQAARAFQDSVLAPPPNVARVGCGCVLSPPARVFRSLGRAEEFTERTHLDEDNGPLGFGTCAAVNIDEGKVESEPAK